MDIERFRQKMKEISDLSRTLGIEYLSTPEEDTCMARMKVDERNRQPFGYLSGGASLAMAENLAGVGSLALCPDKMCMGINVSGNHVKAVPEGETVIAKAKLVQKGHTLHVWHVEIFDSEGDVVSTAHVTNFIVGPKNENRDE